MSEQPTNWHHEVDVLVVGSGNGALTSAICCHDMSKAKRGKAADVLLIEKSDKFGGTSALSGGGVWAPNNRYAKLAGAKDSPEDAFIYLDNAIPKEAVDRKLLTMYLRNAPKMIDFLHDNTHAKYVSLEKYPDYFSDLPGAKNGHRSMEPEAIAITALGCDMDKVRTNGVMYVMYKYAITQTEAHTLMGKSKGWLMLLFRLFTRYYSDIPWLIRRKGFSRRLTGGGAGVVRLFLSVKDRGIPLWLNTAFKSLVIESGRIVGAVVEKEGQLLNIRAREAVLLAAGGFEQNQQMREQYLPKPTNIKWSAGCKYNTGDAIRAGQEVGAATRLMGNAWWCTTKVIPGRPYPFLSIINKSLPGTIVVNKFGRRFSNESQNYMSFLKESFAAYAKGNPCVPAYMVFDHDFRRSRYVWPLFVPDIFLPASFFESGLLFKANTIEGLAASMRVDHIGLRHTIERFNGFVSSGRDLDFHRGDAAYDRYYGDEAFKPNPCLGPILKPPFYAVRLDAGDFGTQGGLVTNENAQVCDKQNQPIAGLYAFGNTSAAILPSYPGPGSTLGPAMTLAYQAAKHLYEHKD